MSLTSIVIPTRNSQKTIRRCIQSAINQTYPKIEIVIVDTCSRDDTLKICREMNCKVLSTDWNLLGSRYLGVDATRGDYVLLLDSDQALKNDVVERCINQSSSCDMICLEEMSSSTSTLIEKMFEADRKLIHSELEYQFDPVRGTLLARFYEIGLLKKALESIPKYLLPSVISHDHAIIYYEAYKISKRVGLITNAVLHNEPSGIIELWKKNFRYGRSTKGLIHERRYNELLKGKVNFRKTKSTFTSEKLLSSILLLLKAPAYLAGLYL